MHHAHVVDNVSVYVAIVSEAHWSLSRVYTDAQGTADLEC